MSQTVIQPDSGPPGAEAPRRNSAGTWILALFAGVSLAATAGQIGACPLAEPAIHCVFAITALAAGIAALAPPLSWTNVLLAAGIAGGMGVIAHAVDAATGLPFGGLDFGAGAGPGLIGLVPWWLPAGWGCIAVTTRGVARFVLAGASPHPCHGLRVIGLATLLAILVGAGLEPFAVQAPGFRAWAPPLLPPLAAWSILQILVQIAITPLLLDKFPVPRPPNIRPVAVWAGVNIPVAAGLMMSGDWTMGVLLAGSMPVLLAVAVGRKIGCRNRDARATANPRP